MFLTYPPDNLTSCYSDYDEKAGEPVGISEIEVRRPKQDLFSSLTASLGQTKIVRA